MGIRDKAVHDPVADLYFYDSAMLWALQAAEEVAGKNGLSIVLRDIGLERLCNFQISDDDTKISRTITFGDYAHFNAGLLQFFGRAGKSMILRIGRASTRQSLREGTAVMKLMTGVAAKMLPLPMQIKMVLEMQQKALRRMSETVGQHPEFSVADRGDRLIYALKDCMVCAGKESDEAMCTLVTGSLQHALVHVTGKEFDVHEVECRATGASACIWEINKTPKE
ncbi:MAG: 4-vinyl reductase [Chloroflexi bacterium]|nr:4-vinyl reductase [Chloroflexota bacterium]